MMTRQIFRWARKKSIFTGHRVSNKESQIVFIIVPGALLAKDCEGGSFTPKQFRILLDQSQNETVDNLVFTPLVEWPLSKVQSSEIPTKSGLCSYASVLAVR